MAFTDSTMWNGLVVMIAILIVPIIPSVLIYKLLPDQKVLVKGDFQGLHLNATGAFAGYLVLAFFAAQVVSSTNKEQREQENQTAPYDTWTILGNVRVDDPSDSVRGARVDIVPPAVQEITPTGQSSARFKVTASLRRDESDGGAMIQITKPPYATASYPVALRAQTDPLTKHSFHVSRDPVRKVMTILDTLVLGHVSKPYAPGSVYNPQIISTISRTP